MMEILRNIDLDNTLIICPDSFKKTILKHLSIDKKIVDAKFMDLNEYRRNWFFDYDLKSIKYLVDKHGLSINNAKEIIENLYYLEDKNYDDEKLNKLLSYKKDLDDNGLLIYNRLFRKQIENRKVIVIGYGKLNKEDKKIIDGEVIEYELKDKKYRIDCFDEIEEEVEYLYNSISDLLYENSVDINNIYILGASTDYDSYFKRFNRYYPFEIEVKDDDFIGGTSLAKKFISMLEENSKEEIYDYLSKQGNEQLISLLNRYPEYELKDIKDYLINDINNTKIRRTNKSNVVKCVDFFTQFDDSDYVFVLGFNDSILSLKNDTDYISDRLKKVLGLSISEEENELKKDNAKAYISGIKHLNISYCKRSPFKSYNQNNLLSDYEYVNHNSSYDYSDKYNQIRYGYMLDSKERYGVEEDDLSLLSKHYKKSDYGTYNNKFNGLSDKQLKDIDKISLSYSSMDCFYKCQFYYYLSYILGLNNYEETFYTKIGSLAHEVLKDYYQDDFDFEKSWDKNIKRFIPEDECESFFMNKLKEEIWKDIEIIKRQDNDSELKDHICERRFEHVLNDRLSFKGFIDKVAYKDNLVSVIDYKTGSTADIKESHMPFGLSLQLPSYMYLLKNDKQLGKDIKYGGFYLQRLINKDINYDEKKDLNEKKNDSMRLSGYTSSDIDRALLCDTTLQSGQSENIASLRLKKDGTFYSNSRVISDEKIEEMINLVDEKVKSAADKIFSGDFVINPKQINKKNESCEYCPYWDICFRKDEDIVTYYTEKEKDDGEVD